MNLSSRISRYIFILTIFSLPLLGQSQGTNEVRVAPQGSLPVELTTQRFSKALVTFRSEVAVSEARMRMSDTNSNGFVQLMQPYDNFNSKLKELSLIAMVIYVSTTYGEMAHDLQTTKESHAVFIESCIAKTEKLLSILERRQSTLFIAPFATSKPPDSLLQLTPYTTTPPQDISLLSDDVLLQLPGGVAVKTDHAFSRFPRGTYWYQIRTRDNHKGRAVLNLVDGDATTISCVPVVGVMTCQTN
jgi:hypothetical protein